MQLSQAFLADFEAEIPKTRAVLAAVPAERFDWRPHPKSMTLGELAGHVAESPSWILGFLEDDFDFAAIAKDYVPFKPTTQAELLGALEANARQAVDGVRGRDDAFMLRTWTMRNGAQVLSSSPRHAALRSILIHHLIHHRGQLTVYLRMVSAPVPPTYGPTADHPSS